MPTTYASQNRIKRHQLIGAVMDLETQLKEKDALLRAERERAERLKSLVNTYELALQKIRSEAYARPRYAWFERRVTDTFLSTAEARRLLAESQSSSGKGA